MSEELTQPELTPEQIEAQRLADLDAIAQQQQQAAEEIASKDKETERLKTETGKLKMLDALKEARLRTGIKFYCSNTELLKLLSGEPDLQVDLPSQTFFSDGKRVEIDDVLRAYRQRNPYLAEKPAVKVQKDGFDGITSRDQLIGTSQKVAFIRKHGQAAFESLPLHAVTRANLLDLPPSELKKLPTSLKSELVRKLGLDGWTRLLDPSREKNRPNEWTRSLHARE